MFCRKCGAKLLDDSQFCPKCGTKVEESGPAEKETPSPPKETKKEASQGGGPLMFSPDQVEADSSESTSAPPQSSASPPPKEETAPSPTEKPAPAEPSKEGKGERLPDSVLPTPDGFAKANEQEQREREKAILEKELQQEKQRWHPLDAYKPLKERMRLGGCALVILIFVVLPLLVVGGLGWMQYNQFVSHEGFESVQQGESNVTEAPEENTFFWHWDLWKGVLYEAEETESEIAIVGGTWWLSGTFKEKVWFRGYQLFLEEGATFEKGLDVNAVRFDPGTSEIEGELTGNIMIQQ